MAAKAVAERGDAGLVRRSAEDRGLEVDELLAARDPAMRALVGDHLGDAGRILVAVDLGEGPGLDLG